VVVGVESAWSGQLWKKYDDDDDDDDDDVTYDSSYCCKSAADRLSTYGCRAFAVTGPTTFSAVR